MIRNATYYVRVIKWNSALIYQNKLFKLMENTVTYKGQYLVHRPCTTRTHVIMHTSLNLLSQSRRRVYLY